MGLYTIAAEEAGNKLAKGLELVVAGGNIRKPAAYPCIDHSDYFAIAVPNSNFTVLEAKFEFKASKKAAFDEKGQEESFAKLKEYKFEEVHEEHLPGEGTEGEVKRFVFKGKNDYELVIESNKFRLSRTKATAYAPEDIRHFSKVVSAVFQTLLKRTEAIEEYELAD
jgi:hypothetical protein